MKGNPRAFPEESRRALKDAALQRALLNLREGFAGRRRAAVAGLPEFDTLRAEARRRKDHVLAHLDHYLELFERKVTERGGKVHWCRTDQEARDAVLAICRAADAKLVTKGKSMISEEIELGAWLERNGIVPVETDLGEYIIQLRREGPSHIIAPAIHVLQDDVAADFRRCHAGLDPARPLGDAPILCEEARQVLRPKFLAADIGVTGANLLVAETGSTIIVTNEGNGDLTQTLPRIHIVLASIEKIVASLDDAHTILRLLARSATGQEFSAYTSVSTGPRREGDLDGPEEFHVILLDNGRTGMLGTEFQEMLTCIRCAACLNHCPVYAAVGGHAYGSCYQGPMGAVLTPQLRGIEEAGHLPNASTFCGRCRSVCPMGIDLPKMMRHWRERRHEKHLSPLGYRAALALWAVLARHPRLYRAASAWAVPLLRLASRLGLGSLPAPEGRTFQSRWASRS